MEPIYNGAEGKLFRLVGSRLELVDAPEISPIIHFWPFGGLSPLGCPRAGSGSDYTSRVVEYVSGAVERVTCSDCRASICKAVSGSGSAPSDTEKAALVSMRNELLIEDYGYWHDDPAVSYIEHVCDVPAVTPEGVLDLAFIERKHDHADQAAVGEDIVRHSPNPPKQFSIREFTGMDSFLGWMLMTTVSKNDKASKAKFERILASAHNGIGDEHTPRYKVELIIDGEQYDLREVAKKIEAQLDASIAKEAGKIVKEKLGDSFFEIAERLQDTARELAAGMKQKAAEMLGFNPWKGEDS